jgi:hypothetical protein
MAGEILDTIKPRRPITEFLDTIKKVAWAELGDVIYGEAKEHDVTPSIPRDRPRVEHVAADLHDAVDHLQAALGRGDVEEITWQAMAVGQLREKLFVCRFESKVKGKRKSERNIQPKAKTGKTKCDAEQYCAEVRLVMAAGNMTVEKAREKVRKQDEWGVSRSTAIRYWNKFGEFGVTPDR